MDSNPQQESSSSSSSDEHADPDYSGCFRRQLKQNSSISKSKNKSMQIQMEVGTSSGYSDIGRRRGSPLATRVRNEKFSLSLTRSRRRRSKNFENKNDQKHVKRNILAWLIEARVVQENTKICYLDESGGQAMKEGLIRRDGILCDCCNTIFTALAFVGHCRGDPQKSYENVFVEEPWNSILSCLKEAWDRTEKLGGCEIKNFVYPKYSPSDRHDDACMLCADGGNLLCCEICPSTYHQDCMDLDVAPEGAWLCAYCVCKFCGDPCGANDYLVTCFQCEKKYHWECYQERNLELVDINSPSTPLCENSCKQVYEKMEKMVGVRKKIGEEYSWTLLRRMDSGIGGICPSDLYQTIVCHAKLAVAKNVMEESFKPIIDRHTRINVIENVMYNRESSYPRINFRGFYSAILEKDEEIISVASLRIHGTKLAEMPFIATQERYRSQGMCRKLMLAIESALCYLNVENLVIPSIQERIGTWIDGYGFQRITPSLIEELKHRHTVTFHDSFRLQKTLPSGKSIRMKTRTSSCKDLFDLNFEPPKEELNDEKNDIASK